jgi:hypothetical protein
MSITDALGTAMKMLGVAAKIYEGLYDGSKYRDVDGIQEDVPVFTPKRTTAELMDALPSLNTSDIEPMPKAKEVKSTGKTSNYDFFKVMANEKKRVGDEEYYKVMGGNGYKHCNEIKNREEQIAIYKELCALPTLMEEATHGK